MIPKYRTFGDQYKHIHKILIHEAAMCILSGVEAKVILLTATTSALMHDL